MSAVAKLALSQNKLGEASRSVANATNILRAARQDLLHLEKHGASESKVDSLHAQIETLEAATADMRGAVEKL